MIHQCVFAVVFCSLFMQYTDAASQGAVRFVRNGLPTLSQAWSAGIVQIYYDGSWGNICDDSSFGQDEADVLCHQFGYTGASSYSNTGNTFIYGDDDLTSTAIEDVSCSSSTYLTITQCSFNEANFATNCPDVIVTCYTTRIWDSPTSGDIRLTGGIYSNQGLLEIYCNDEWGTVCDDDFSSTEASVACNQLGYNDYTDYDHLSQRGFSQSIWLQFFSGCFSSSSCLTSCDSCPLTAVTGCSHSEDITLECEYDSSDSQVFTTTNTDCDQSTTVDLSGLASAVVTVIVVVCIISCLICVAVIAIPICICLCIGFGVGAASRSTPRTTVVAQPAPAATVVATTSGGNQNMAYQPAGAGSQYPTAQYPAGYPTQPPPPYANFEQPQGYPAKGPGYPPQ